MFLKHLELFSGIGGFRQALELLSRDFGVKQETIGFSEIDRYAIKTYKSAFPTSEKSLGDIIAFNRDVNNIIDLDDFSLLTGGFPCQPFSMMGSQNGFKDNRGGLFFEIITLVQAKSPRYILLENVRNLITHNKGETIKTIVNQLSECGYHVYYDVFNTKDFGLAQTRNRVYIFATRDELPGFTFNAELVKDVFEKELKNKCSLLFQENTHQVLEKEVDKKFYLSERIKPTILSNGTKTFVSKSTINPLIARPLTATMVKMHRACQDNYFSDGYISSDDPYEYVKIQYTKDELAKQRIRKLTPKEAFLLQGFNEEYFDKISNCGNSQGQLYKQAGNAVSVNTVYSIMYYIFVHNKVGEWYVFWNS